MCLRFVGSFLGVVCLTYPHILPSVYLDGARTKWDRFQASFPRWPFGTWDGVVRKKRGVSRVSEVQEMGGRNTRNKKCFLEQRRGGMVLIMCVL